MSLGIIVLFGVRAQNFVFMFSEHSFTPFWFHTSWRMPPFQMRLASGHAEEEVRAARLRAA